MITLEQISDLITWAICSGGFSVGIMRAIGRLFGGGGGGGNITYNVPQPAAPTPIDYDKMYDAATRSAIAQMREEEAQLKRLYPTMTGLQFDTVNQLARGLDNEYLQRNRRVIDQELRSAFAPNQIEREIQGRALGDFLRGPTDADRQIESAGRNALGVRADQVGGPSNIREIGAANVGAGQLGETLMSQAMRRAQSEGRLSPEASRDAVQSARAGMAARGMATGSAGMAAELLNRDRYSRARMAEDNAFASSVQGQDVQRQFQNQDAQMRVSMANQQRDQSLGDMLMRAQMANQSANFNQNEANRAFMLQSNAAFQGAEADRRNMALGANQLDLARRQRRLGLASAYADLDPYTRATGPAFQVGSANTGQGLQAIGQTFGNALNQSGNVASFNSNLQAGMYNSWQNNNAAIQAANITGRASQQAGQMAMMGGMMQGLGSYFSDKRMKKDIKPLGKAGSVLGLTAYEFSYKGDKEKHVGFMAQDVKKVLPEAVEEVEHKGKKRLTIKPAVIGAAIAEQLSQAKAA